MENIVSIYHDNKIVYLFIWSGIFELCIMIFTLLLFPMFQDSVADSPMAGIMVV